MGWKQLFSGKKQQNKQSPGGSPTSDPPAQHEVEQQPIRADVDRNLASLKELLKDCTDVVYRTFETSLPNPRRVVLVYVDGLVDKKTIDEAIMIPLMVQAPRVDGGGADTAHQLNLRLLPQNQVKEVSTIGAVIDGIMRGNSALLVDGQAIALLCATEGWEKRPIEEPKAEKLVRGPREGFTENLRTNTAMLRRRLPTPALKFEEMKIGRLTQTRVLIAYLDPVVSQFVLKEVRRRLSQIDIDGVLESGYLEEFIEDSPWSPFPQLEHTERPDKTAGALLDGRVAIMTDTTPFVLLAPVTLPQFFLTSEDYYVRFWNGTMFRWVRILAAFFAILLPALYIAITTFQPELLPTTLLISLAATREGVPFPALVEALMMEITMEVLREAGERLPQAVGQAVSIVGGLVIGESAVRAGIASPAMVIVVSFTAIASFAIPAYAALHSVRMLRFVMMFLASTLGLPGVMWGVLALYIHVASMRSFGVPYLSPLAPLKPNDLKDTVVRAPWWAMVRRPWIVNTRARPRQPSGQGPTGQKAP